MKVEDLTEGPTSTKAVHIRSSRSFCPAGWLIGSPEPAPMKARATCAQNSTAIPNEMTRLTRLMALRLMPQTDMMPMTETTVDATTNVTIVAVLHDPRKMAETINTAPKPRPRTS